MYGCTSSDKYKLHDFIQMKSEAILWTDLVFFSWYKLVLMHYFAGQIRSGLQFSAVHIREDK